MFLVGLTGGIASGKSSVAKIFKTHYGCPVIDADRIARLVVEPGNAAYNEIKEAFGEGVFLPTGELNREQLGQIIFNDESKRRKLNAIVHPAIKKEMLRQIISVMLQGHQFAILDIPLLFETKQMLPFISYSIVVYCTEDQQLERLMSRNNLDEEAARARINSQMSLGEKCQLSTYIIDNTQSINVTEEHVNKVHSQLRASNKHLLFRFGMLSLLVPVAFALVYVFRYIGLL